MTRHCTSCKAVLGRTFYRCSTCDKIELCSKCHFSINWSDHPLKMVSDTTPLSPLPDDAYENLQKAREAFQADHLANPFPRFRLRPCTKPKCIQSEFNNGCHHCLGEILQLSGQYSRNFLLKERVRWHPDKFSGKGDGPLKATEMFKMIQRLIEE
jgi:hypothetical protein